MPGLAVRNRRLLSLNRGLLVGDCACCFEPPAGPCCEPARPCAPRSVVEPCGGPGEPDCEFVLGVGYAVSQTSRIYRETFGSGQPLSTSGTYLDVGQSWPSLTAPGGRSPTKPPAGEIPEPQACDRCFDYVGPELRFQTPDPGGTSGLFYSPVFEVGSTGGGPWIPGVTPCQEPTSTILSIEPGCSGSAPVGRYSIPFRFPEPDLSVLERHYLAFSTQIGFSLLNPLTVVFALRVRDWLDNPSDIQIRAGFESATPCEGTITIERMERSVRFLEIVRDAGCWPTIRVGWSIDWAIVYEDTPPRAREELLWQGSATIAMLGVGTCDEPPPGLAILPRIPG